MKNLFYSALVVLFFLGFVAAVNYAIGENEKSDCLTWQTESEVLKGFYLTQDEADQCNALHIIIHAPVK